MHSLVSLCLVCVVWSAPIGAVHGSDTRVYLRVNQVGYLPDDAKVGVAFSHAPVSGTFSLLEDDSGRVAFASEIGVSDAHGWGTFEHYYRLDFTKHSTPGCYRLRIDASGDESRPFTIGQFAYENIVEESLRFLRQQRCGYNPVLDSVCHQRDGRTAYGPLPPGTYLDASGGWHDAGDQLKYLLTGSNATARLLLAYELEPTKFDDRVDRLGQPLPNGVPDVLDEARWGLDWLHKMHPSPSELYHQVADDRDHNGWKLPDEDTSDYGWGPNSYRVLYGADGQPQGLGKYQSESTGLANLAGRCAAAMSLAHRIWKRDLDDPVYAAQCLQAARELYALGQSHEGVQQGNSYGAPYRYGETTWADDMEWAAAELFAETGDPEYLSDAKRYARLAADVSWMPLETAEHYQYYPFVNVGHFALYPHVPAEVQAELAGYYRTGIEATLNRTKKNAFGVGVPFIWCSNNLATALVTQLLLYERMTGDLQYHGLLLAQRDWLFGCNPWGTSMFTGIPRGGEFPEDVHTSTWKLTRRAVAGGLVDGPVSGKVYNSLLGLHLSEDDEFAAFQTPHVVYHDDVGDYSTNEPTMDGTADAVLLLAHFGVTPQAARTVIASRMPLPPPDFEVDAGGIRRGSRSDRKLALVFAADEYVDGADSILQTLQSRQLQAAYFLTGRAVDAPGMREWVRRAIAAGQYVGPHSDGHLLYAPWDKRQESLVDKRRFQADLYRNLAELRELGAAAKEPVYFVPPYEWYNAQHAAWAAELGCQIVCFTPGIGSHRDFAPEGHEAFRPTMELIQEILDYETQSANGLNGHLLLLHLGSARKDKVFPKLGDLIDELLARGYTFVRIDKLLGKGAHRNGRSESVE